MKHYNLLDWKGIVDPSSYQNSKFYSDLRNCVNASQAATAATERAINQIRQLEWDVLALDAKLEDLTSNWQSIIGSGQYDLSDFSQQLLIDSGILLEDGSIDRSVVNTEREALQLVLRHLEKTLSYYKNASTFPIAETKLTSLLTSLRKKESQTGKILPLLLPTP